ncbi:BQ5605_C040g11906 [Microbotryum silenes-dioicae]|uniref:BQ5605_C040g11906 protein n=1 Tax=Microbotryum silenes-dioicae TaxID=796604 RepID=A0A2X0MTM3_9BASI|nr:BQ5605_C040g11906 [Microbotryum silenes-dioicae]
MIHHARTNANAFQGHTSAKPTTSRDHQSTNTTPELPTPRSRAAHWRLQLTQQDRVDPIELRKKLRLLLVDKFGEDFVPRPVQIRRTFSARAVQDSKSV